MTEILLNPHHAPDDDRPMAFGDTVTLHRGDSLAVLKTLPEASIDSLVTDPPAGIAFMGRGWDTDKGGRRQWISWLTSVMEEAHRVLKPGGHALVWALPRTSHWTATALEDAGFEIRDCVVHLFGSGLPKSLDVGKAIDQRLRGQLVRAKLLHFITARGVTGRWLVEQGVADAKSLHDWTEGGHVPSHRNWQIVKAALGVTSDEEAAFERDVIGWGVSGATAIMQGIGLQSSTGGAYAITASATDDAKRWDGWGTALKPGQEHWWLVRKPLSGTVAANVLEHGTGAINVDGCRVPGGSRWPTNLVLTHSYACQEAGPCAEDCPAGELDRQSGWTPSNSRAEKGNGLGYRGAAGRPGGWSGDEGGGASRFYPTFRYQAKAPSRERPKLDDGTAWPTVKPVGLMRWLVRLVTPPGGVVLDPFAGTGTTAEAAVSEGFRSVLIEQDETAIELIKVRMSKVDDLPPAA